MDGFTVKAVDIAKSTHMEITISGYRTFMFRAWVAIKLIRLAAVVFPANVHVIVGGQEES